MANCNNKTVFVCTFDGAIFFYGFRVLMSFLFVLRALERDEHRMRMNFNMNGLATGVTIDVEKKQM